MNNHFLLLVMSVLFFFSCQKSSLDSALNIAGENELELENVLDHYSTIEDSLKHQAAIFLIENMIHHYSVSQEISVKGENSENFDWNNYQIEHLLVQDKDSLLKLKKAIDSLGIRIKPGEIIMDIKSIKAELLVENIDYAFKVWDMPWCRHLCFEDFCEYILPYRCQSEPLTQWRRCFYEKYSWIKDSLPDDCTPLVAASYLQKVINNEVVWLPSKTRFYSGFLSPFMFERIKAGDCGNLCVYTSLAMRSVGVPVTYDLVLYWSGRNSGHAFNCLVANDSIRGYLFNVCDGPPNSAIKPHRATRIMRTTFQLQDNPLWNSWAEGESIPPSLVGRYQKDVTNIKVATDTLKINVDNIGKTEKRIWLCTITPNSLKVFNYSEIDDDGWLCFPTVNNRLVYVLARYNNKVLTPISSPFYLKDQSVTYLKPDKRIRQNYSFEGKLKTNEKLPKKIIDLTVMYWEDGWNKVEARAEFLYHLKYNERLQYNEGIFNIQLKNAPQNAFFYMKDDYSGFTNDFSWFTFSDEGQYQKR